MPNPKRAKRPPLDIDLCAMLYRDGKSYRALAKMTGYCYGTVRRQLIDYGVPPRKPGGNRRPRTQAA